MISKMKGICLVLLAVAAMAAWTAAPAQAELEFESWETVEYGESEEEREDLPVPATLSASQSAGEPIALSVGESQIKCTTVTATSSLETGSSPTIDLAPTYEGCKLAGIFSVELSAGSCAFRAHLASEPEAGVFTGSSDIVCAAEGQIVAKITALGKTLCSVHIAPQNELKTSKAIDMTEDTPDDFTLKSELESIKETVEEGEGSCPITLGSYTNGKYTGNMLVTAKGTGGETPPVPIQPKKIEKFHFTLENANEVEIVASSQGAQEFKFDTGKISCSGVSGRDEATNGITTLTAFDFEGTAYEECENVNSMEKAEVVFNGCAWRVRAGTVEQTRLISGVNVACLPGGKMEVRVKNCTSTIQSQTGQNKLGIRRAIVQNTGSKKTREIRVEFKLTGIAYEEGEGAACQSPNVLKNNGTMTGTVFFRAVEEEGAMEQVGLWVETTP